MLITSVCSVLHSGQGTPPLHPFPPCWCWFMCTGRSHCVLCVCSWLLFTLRSSLFALRSPLSALRVHSPLSTLRVHSPLFVFALRSPLSSCSLSALFMFTLRSLRVHSPLFVFALHSSRSLSALRVHSPLSALRSGVHRRLTFCSAATEGTEGPRLEFYMTGRKVFIGTSSRPSTQTVQPICSLCFMRPPLMLETNVLALLMRIRSSKTVCSQQPGGD